MVASKSLQAREKFSLDRDNTEPKHTPENRCASVRQVREMTPDKSQSV
jgi:hypothetical protein